MRSTGAGLNPPTPSSVAPIGMPTRPTLPGIAIPVGEDADAAGRAKAVLMPGAQVPDAFPSVPPPSNVAVIDVVACVPGIPGVMFMEPSEACGIALPNPEQIDTLLVDGPIDETPEAVGLTPKFVSSVAPSGMPVGATGVAAPIPSGEVAPSSGGVGAPIGPICAIADVHGSNMPSVAINSQRFMSISGVAIAL